MVSLMLTISNIMHVGQLAEYYITQEENSLNIKVVLEKEEMLSFNFKSNCDVQKMTSLCVSNHIKENLIVEVNNKIILLDLGDSYTEYGHLILFFTGKLKNDKVSHLNIRSNCFYKFHANYRNRFILNLEEFQNSYMLTKEKNSLSIK